jgi:hypothetical protein
MPYTANEPWLFAFIQKIRTRPGMYLGSESVRTLETYLQGYIQARRDLGVPELPGDQNNVLDEFGVWLALKLKSKRNFGWAVHIELMDPSSANVHTFFREFQEFLNSTGRTPAEDVADRWPPDPWPSKHWAPP